MKYNWFLNILNLLSWILNWRQYALRLYLTFKPDFSLCNNLDRQLRSLSLDIVSIRYFFLGFRSRCFVQTRFRLIVQLLISFVRRHSFSAALHFRWGFYHAGSLFAMHSADGFSGLRWGPRSCGRVGCAWSIWGVGVFKSFLLMSYTNIVVDIGNTMFISNNRASFYLWWKENLVKHQKVSKYHGNDCR